MSLTLHNCLKHCKVLCSDNWGQREHSRKEACPAYGGTPVGCDSPQKPKTTKKEEQMEEEEKVKGRRMRRKKKRRRKK